MRKREFRISAAEDAVGGPQSVAQPRWHVVVQQPGQDRSEALDVYGRARIAATDEIIFGMIADPADGAASDDSASSIRFLLPPIDTAQDAERGGAALLEAASEGEISAGDALLTMGLLVAQADLISAGDHERRLVRLERRFR